MRLAPAILLAGSLLWGGGPATGGYAGAFTRLGGNARNAALAGALAADVNSGHLALTNPASLVYVQRREVGLTYVTLPLDRSLQGLCLATGLPPSAAVGVSYLRAGDDNIQGRNNVGERTEVLTYSENMVALSFANRLSPTLSLGFNAKLLFINLADEGSTGFGIDLGLLYHRPSGFNVALKIRNLAGVYAWKVPTSEGSREYHEYFPHIISFAARLPWRHFTFFGQADVVVPKTKDGDDIVYGNVVPIFRLAVEDLLGERYFLRGGLENTTLSLGTGLRYSIRQPYDSRVDYGLSLGKAGEGMGHLFTWTFSI